jgi:hypothetical protein
MFRVNPAWACDAILRRQVSIRKALRAWQAVAVQGRVCVCGAGTGARAGPGGGSQ